jgi:hypothetical protein
LLIRRGINLIKLISSPSQATDQEEAEQAIRVPNIRVRIKINRGVFVRIKKGKIKTFMDGV